MNYDLITYLVCLISTPVIIYCFGAAFMMHMGELGRLQERTSTNGTDPDLVKAFLLGGSMWLVGALLGFKSLLAGAFMMILGAIIVGFWLWEVEQEEDRRFFLDENYR